MTIEIKQKGTPMKFTFADLRGLIFAIACLALMPNSSSAQSKLVVAIQPTVASDEMLNKAKPL